MFLLLVNNKKENSDEAKSQGMQHFNEHNFTCKKKDRGCLNFFHYFAEIASQISAGKMV